MVAANTRNVKRRGKTFACVLKQVTVFWQLLWWILHFKILYSNTGSFDHNIPDFGRRVCSRASLTVRILRYEIEKGLRAVWRRVNFKCTRDPGLSEAGVFSIPGRRREGGRVADACEKYGSYGRAHSAIALGPNLPVLTAVLSSDHSSHNCSAAICCSSSGTHALLCAMCTVYTQCTVHSAQCTVYSALCTVYSAQCAFHSAQCARSGQLSLGQVIDCLPCACGPNTKYRIFR